ncbi:MAG: hypothetical protein KY452_12825, partial [Actinobacteria bacterium]|nr:hypothetical protein [Actinomycetota bacterium]
MTAVLLAAVLVPLMGAVLALAVPAPDRPRRPRPSRRPEPAPEAAGPGDDAGVPSGTDTAAAAAPPDPAAVEQAAATSRITVRAAALAAAGLWVVVTLVGHVVAGPFTAAGPVGPAGVGAALLLASVRHPVRRRSAVAGAVALTLLTGGLALVAGTGSLLLAAALLVAGATMIAVTSRGDGEGLAGGLALAGMAVVAGGLIRLSATQPESAFLTAPGTGGVLLPAELPGQATAALLAVGAVVAAVAGALRARTVAAPLLAVGLAVGIPAVAALGPEGDAVAVLLGLAAVAVAGAWAARLSDGLRPLVVALALLALAAAAADTAVPAGLPSGGLPAAWLLAASAVVTAVALTPLAALSAVPGAAALTTTLVADPQPVRLTLVALVVVTATLAAVALARGRDDAWGRAGPAGAHDHDDGPLLAGLPAVAVGTWLVVAPGTWAWAGAPTLDGWSESLAVALAGGLGAVVASAAAGRVAIPGTPRLVGPDPEMA